MPNEFKVGDKVRLQLGMDGLRYSPKGLKRWDECTFVIIKRKTLMTPARNQMTYYELRSCKSPMGINYTILEEWLTPTR